MEAFPPCMIFASEVTFFISKQITRKMSSFLTGRVSRCDSHGANASFSCEQMKAIYQVYT